MIGSAGGVRMMSATCFYEIDPTLSLLRRGLVEGIGTLLLMFIVAMSHTPLAGAAALVVLSHIPSQCAGAMLAFGIIRAAYESSTITNRSSAKP